MGTMVPTPSKKGHKKGHRMGDKGKFEAALPTNKAINDGLDKAQVAVHKSRKEDGVDDTGRVILDKTENVLSSAQAFLNEKNSDELIQRLLLESRAAFEENKDFNREKWREFQKQTDLIDSEDLRVRAQELGRTARMIGAELITSRSFRKTLFEFMAIVYYTLIDATGADERLGTPLKKAYKSGQGHWGEKIQGELTERGLEYADKSIHTAESRASKTREPPVVQQVLGRLDQAESMLKKEGGTPSTSGGVYEQGVYVTEKPGTIYTPDQGLTQATTTTVGVTQTQQQGPRATQGYQKGKKKVKTGTEKAKYKIQQAKEKQRTKPYKQHQGEARSHVRQAGKGAREIVRDLRYMELTDEQVDRIVERAQVLMYNISQRQRTRDIVNGMFDLVSILRQPIDRIIAESKATKRNIQSDDHLYNIAKLLRKLVEGFTGQGSLDRVLYHFKKIWSTVSKEPELMAYFREVRTYVRTYSTQHPNDVNADEMRGATERLVRRGRQLFDPRQSEAISKRRTRLREHFHGLFVEMRETLYAIENDPTTRRLEQDIRSLVSEMLLDERGNVTFKKHHLDQLRLIAFSAVVRRMRLPLPPIHFKDEKRAFELTVTGLTLRIADVLPNNIKAKHKGGASLDIKHDAKNAGMDKAKEKLTFVMKNINLHIPEADIWFERSKFPKLRDSGLLYVDVGGRGIDVYVTIQTSANSKHLFTVEKVDCDVHDLKITLDKTHHDFTYNTVLKLANGRIKKSIEDSVEDAIANALERLNTRMEKQLHVMKQRSIEGGQRLREKTQDMKRQREMKTREKQLKNKHKAKENKLKKEHKLKEKKHDRDHKIKEKKIKDRKHKEHALKDKVKEAVSGMKGESAPREQPRYVEAHH